MTFKIVVCIKQVPDTNDIKWTPMNTIQREGMDSVINPFDLGAIQFALDLKKRFNDAQITLVSMGPKQAEESLRYGLALGADEAYLLCDKKFAASDTLATAYCLSCFVGKYVSDVRFYVSAQNLHTFTGYKGYNVDYAGGTFTPGYNFCSFPTARTFMCGLHFSF